MGCSFSIEIKLGYLLKLRKLICLMYNYVMEVGGSLSHF